MVPTQPSNSKINNERLMVKGERTEKSCPSNTKACTPHAELKVKMVPTQPSTSLERPSRPPTFQATRTRINRLPRNIKFEVVLQTPNREVVLKWQQKRYILKLPRDLIIPNQPIRYYLIRDPLGMVRVTE